MKYLFLIPELKRGGPNNVIKNMITSFNFSNIEIYIVSIRKSSDFDFIGEFENIPNVGLINLNARSFLGKVSVFKKTINTLKPDVIHSHGFYPDIFMFFISNNFKKITTIHNIIYQDYYSRYGVRGYIYSLLHYLFLRFSNFYKIFGCSKEVACSLKKITYLRNIDYVNNGIDIEKFSPLSLIERHKIKEKLGLENTLIISFCGGVERVKRVPELFQQYISKLPIVNYKFLIIGDGPEINRIPEMKNLIKLGRVNNPEVYLKISDIIVSNSSSEGYPMAILEALSCGCKAFLSDIPSHKDIIKNYPNCAFDLDYLNEKKICEVLENKLSKDELYNLSAEKMSFDYLSKISG